MKNMFSSGPSRSGFAKMYFVLVEVGPTYLNLFGPGPVGFYISHFFGSGPLIPDRVDGPSLK